MLYAKLSIAYLATVWAAGDSMATTSSSAGSTCHDLKSAYQSSLCCNSDLSQETSYSVAPSPPRPMSFGTNYCAGTKPASPGGFDNMNCTQDQQVDGIVEALEQAGANVTAGYVGGMDVDTLPTTEEYYTQGLCPVNVHWHLGAEHLSQGEFDEDGSGPGGHRLMVRRERRDRRLNGKRVLGDNIRQGFQCHHYDASNPKFTTAYDWKYCTNMEVGQTYEVHWPHSKGGACGTVFQFQSPFYDGVFCHGSRLAPTTQEAIGVQGQVFTIVNDEDYYYPDLMRGMIVDGEHGADIAKYTGSTTGTTRDNTICSAYAPITWQVDRKCHMISASSFDKMCKDMLSQQDDMSGDTHAHGARELVANHLAADNLQRKA